MRRQGDCPPAARAAALREAARAFALLLPFAQAACHAGASNARDASRAAAPPSDGASSGNGAAWDGGSRGDADALARALARACECWDLCYAWCSEQDCLAGSLYRDAFSGRPDLAACVLRAATCLDRWECLRDLLGPC